jgi:hypothetical protein
MTPIIYLIQEVQWVFFYFYEGQSVDLAGKYSYLDNNRFHRYKFAENN